MSSVSRPRAAPAVSTRESSTPTGWRVTSSPSSIARPPPGTGTPARAPRPAPCPVRNQPSTRTGNGFSSSRDSRNRGHPSPPGRRLCPSPPDRSPHPNPPGRRLCPSPPDRSPHPNPPGRRAFRYAIEAGGATLFERTEEGIKAPRGRPFQIVKHLTATKEQGSYTIRVKLSAGTLSAEGSSPLNVK